MKKTQIILALLLIFLIFIVGIFIYNSQQKRKSTTSTSNSISEDVNNTTSTNNVREQNITTNAYTTPLEKHGKLSVKGTNIIDKNGNIFQLKGVSTHGIAWFPQYINKDAFLTIRDDWGANAIRLALYSDPNAGYSTRFT